MFPATIQLFTRWTDTKEVLPTTTKYCETLICMQIYSPLEFYLSLWDKTHLFASQSTSGRVVWLVLYYKNKDIGVSGSLCSPAFPFLDMTFAPFQGWKIEKEMATHSRILAWKIPWTEGPGGLQSMGSQRVGHNWVTNTKDESSGNKRLNTCWHLSSCY